MWGFTPWDRGKCRDLFRSKNYEGVFTAPSLKGSITYPDNLGVMNWGSAAIDPARNLLVINTSHVATVAQLVPREQADARFAKGEWLLAQEGTPYAAQWTAMLSPWGAPCNKPPWGRLVAVDLARGTLAWSASTSVADDDPGSSGYGPALVTASGLVFHGGTHRSVLRVHDIANGARIATFPLPAGLHAGPISYKLRPEGKQYLVVAPGGHVGIGSELGDSVIAYTLPD
jgi:quinoprotein glucose dehydrogenase